MAIVVKVVAPSSLESYRRRLFDGFAHGGVGRENLLTTVEADGRRRSGCCCFC